MNEDCARSIRRLRDAVVAIDEKIDARLQMVQALEMRRARLLREIAEQEQLFGNPE